MSIFWLGLFVSLILIEPLLSQDDKERAKTIIYGRLAFVLAVAIVFAVYFAITAYFQQMQ